MPVRRLNHAVLFVRDVAASTAFYADMLGFTPIEGMAGLTGAAFLRAPSSTNDHDLGLFEIGTGRAPDQPDRPGLYHLAWEVGTLADLAETREKLVQAGALVGESDHRVSKSLYAKDPSGIEFEVMWRVPAQDWAAETADGQMILPLDIDAAIARWGQDQVTGAAAGSPT
jgi:catechol-2,3-dioxygenase